MIGTVYLVRLLPLLFLRRDIRNKWVKSFFYYVPYVTLAVMTFPAILQATAHPVAGLVALIVGVLASVFLGDMFTVAILCCVAAYVSGLFL
ncbi:MAG: AzlD domain-containing protein [Lachnospiraceae bacterium]|nr:AzlD domain-containing protein [Lachnospiraceae bacterium]